MLMEKYCAQQLHASLFHVFFSYSDKYSGKTFKEKDWNWKEQSAHS